MRQQKASLFLDCVDQEAWLANVEGKPELFCIYGPYINQRIIRELYGKLPQNRTVSNLPTTHHDAHWHHSGSRAPVFLSKVKKALALEGEVKDDCVFVMREGLKIREERDGYLISDNNTAYFINNTASRLLKLLGNRMRVNDIKLFCEKLGIPKPAGMGFFRRLVIFGLCRPI